MVVLFIIEEPTMDTICLQKYSPLNYAAYEKTYEKFLGLLSHLNAWNKHPENYGMGAWWQWAGSQMHTDNVLNENMDEQCCQYLHYHSEKYFISKQMNFGCNIPILVLPTYLDLEHNRIPANVCNNWITGF